MPYPAKLSPDTILRTALELLERDGLAAFSMRMLAERLSVRVSSLYRHYPDRVALEAALADEAARALHTVMQHASAGQQDGAALTAASQAYLAFARERAELYGLLHVPRPPVPAQPGAGKDLWNFLLQLVGGVTGRDDDTSGAVAVWAYLHGFASLERSGLFGLSGPRGGFERGLDALTRGL